MKTGEIYAGHYRFDCPGIIDFFVDTALSWDGIFPAVGAGDYLVGIRWEGVLDYVLVSRRYTEAQGYEDAALIALDAYREKHSTCYGVVVSVERVTE